MTNTSPDRGTRGAQGVLDEMKVPEEAPGEMGKRRKHRGESPGALGARGDPDAPVRCMTRENLYAFC